MKVAMNKSSGFSQEQGLVIKTVLDGEKTSLLLRQVPKAYKTQINDILLTALVLAYGDVTGHYTISFYLEGHGRESIHKDIDLSRTVGWFTSIFPITLSIEKVKEINLVIKSVKTQLAKIPSRGISYWLLRYLVPEGKVLKKSLEPEIIFNYLGQIDQVTRKSSILRTASESCGSYSHPKNKRSYPVEISAYIKGGVFEITWSVDRDNESHKIEKLAIKYIKRLEEIIDYCVQSSNFGYIPLDFPLANIDQEALDKVFGRIKGIEDIYPLSPLQSGLLFHALSDVESDAYIVQTLYTFKGDVISANLKNAIQEISNHYDAFKTGFVWDNISEPLQFVLRQSELEWKEEDWSLLSKDDQDTKVQELLREDRKLKFNLKIPPLSRWYFIRISKNKSYLLWTHHHILLDGWSGAIILSQLLKVYQQLTENKELHLLQTPPYKNFIKYLTNIDKEGEKKFWQQYLDKVEPCYLSSKLLSFQQESNKSYERCQFMFPEEMTSKIKEQAKNLKVTLNTLLQGAWSILLKRYTQSDRVIFGVTVSGRNIDLEGINESIGLFINTLPLKVQVRDNQTLRSFLEELQCNMADINNFSYTSLARIKSYCVQKHQDLFNTLLIFENFPTGQKYDNPTKSVQIENAEAFETIEYALNIAIKADEQLHFNVGFQTRFFDIKGIEKIIKDLMDILNSIVLGKEDKVGNVAEKISIEELKNIQLWNKTDCILLDTITPQIYEQVANAYPNKICARFLEKYLTYNELREKANRLANYFIKNDLVKKKPIGICLERSLDNVVVMLAIWKASGCYVPLDPGFPYERLQYMIEDAGIDFLISSSILSEKLKEKGLLVENIDDLWGKSINESIETPPCTADGSSLAYIIYTSGSTGVPKGVMVEHRSLMNFLVSMAKKPGIKKEDKFLAVTTPAFDISGLEIWLPLLNGAELIIAPQIKSTSGKNLSEMIETFGITMMQATPATWQMLLDDGWSEKETKMKILSGGDILSSQVALKLLANKNELWNMYGPTETTIWSTTIQILSNSVISIGKPIDNTEIYILDEQMRMVGIGIPGEIYIGGVGLARGYINNPGLTKEKFVENPFSEDKFSRLYKTGDLGRYLEDGNIQHLGRIDNQIKLRGYRIEPGEIETYIDRYEGVNTCVVLVKKDKKEHESLVAYVVLQEKGKHGEHLEEKKTEQLRQELRKKVPEYMVPNYFIEVDELPLNANGKIDRKKLPEIDAVGRKKEKKREEGTISELERNFLAIWKDLLPVKKISIHDNFFYLGGDSIIAIKLVSQARQRDIVIDVNQVFAFPTIYELAKSVEQADGINQKKQLLAKELYADLYPFNQEYLKQIPKDREALDAYPLSPMQETFVYMDFSQKSQESNFIQNTYEIRGKIDSEKLRNAWHNIFRETAIFRTGIYYDEERGLLQYVCKNLSLPWQYYDLSNESEQIKRTKIDQIFQKSAERNFKIDNPPLVNLHVIKLAEESYYLIVSYHHIIMDGWCIPLLIEKIKEKYQEEKYQKEALSKTIFTPYWVYIDWLMKQDKEKAKQFWKDQLKEFSEPTYLEVNREKREKNSHIYEDFKYLLTDKQTKDVLSFAKSNNISLNTLMQVAWAFLLYHYTRKTDILFGVTVSGRSMNIPSIDEMIGLCINTVPLRIKIEEEEDFKSLLLKNQKNMVEIQNYAYLSLAEVRKIANIKGEAPLFDSIFVFENYPKIHHKKNELEISFISALSRGEYPLGITVVPGDKILFKFDFGTDYFNRIFIQKVAHTLEEIVMSLIEDRG